VDRVPGHQPQQYRHGRLCEPADDTQPVDGQHHRRQQAEDQKRRSPVGDHHVLEQMEAQHRGQRQVLDRREQCNRDQRQAGGKQRAARRLNGHSAAPVGPGDDRVVDREHDDGDRPFRVEGGLPGIKHRGGAEPIPAGGQ
jgi:hypothetical protein